ncbi:hypothetical protein SAY86_012345 [Trapa natans]|uniref:CCT domain-containing protein n=1 Tax=Trapa natans TaxID=22666 RepID=A0AAN7LWK6_TRANT|nr:hypothetical protein SAY86_012345 [Trapa natans]
MSSDLFLYDSDLPFMPSDPLIPFSLDPDSLLHDDPIDQLSAAADYSVLPSSSPPSYQLEGLTLRHAAAASLDFPGVCLPTKAISSYPTGLPSPFVAPSLDFPDVCLTGVLQEGVTKGDGSPVGYDENAFVGAHSYAGHEGGISSHVAKYMQRSYSSCSFDERPAEGLYQSQFDALMESSESCFPDCTQMRRVYSTGDLQGSYMEETNLKVGRYSAEERKERILKYRAKRTQRNFTKTIKYACRKTLADSRPRIRGRFARNDEAMEGLPKSLSSSSVRVRDDDLLWPGQQDDDDFGAGSIGGHYLDQVQFHYTYNCNF